MSADILTKTVVITRPASDRNVHYIMRPASDRNVHYVMKPAIDRNVHYVMWLASDRNVHTSGRRVTEVCINS